MLPFLWTRFIGLLLLFFCPFLPLCAAKPPQLSPRDTRIKIEEILKAHVSYHHLNGELLTRAFKNYLDEIDPNKAYLIKNEVIKWIEPSNELLEETLSNLKKENFVNFEELHETIISAIERRNSIEKNISDVNLPKNTRFSDFKELDWALSEQDLQERVLLIRALQIETGEKLHPESKGYLKERLEKRRLRHQDDLIATSSKERQRVILSLTLKAISGALDSQTTYFTPSEANYFMAQVQQSVFGIGALLKDNLNGLVITRLLDGGPAKEGNRLKVNDRIIAVNKEPIIGMDMVEAVELIRGPKGTRVILTVVREHGDSDNKEEELLNIEIPRGEVVIKEMRLEKNFEPFGDGFFGIFHLLSFYQDTHSSSSSDLLEAIEEGKKRGNLKGIILDLRDNGGGLLSQAVAVTSLFIQKGIVVSIKDNTGTVQHLRNTESKLALQVLACIFFLVRVEMIGEFRFFVTA